MSLVTAWNQARSELRDAESFLWAAEKQLIADIAKTHGVNASGIQLSDEWDCATSPTKFCVFHNSTCLFCREPQQRQ